MKYETAYFCGYAKLPQSLSANTIYSILTLGLEIELNTGLIRRTSCTLLTSLAEEMVSSYMSGKNILTDYENMVDEITVRHQGCAQKPIIKALGEIYRKFSSFKSNNL